MMWTCRFVFPLTVAAMAGAAITAGCQPATTRPGFTPYPEAAQTEVRLGRADATVQLAASLRADSIPVAVVQPRDGYLDSGWFDRETGRPYHRRPVGTDVVRVRAWAEPARPYASVLVVETVYRPVADPSLPARELERPVDAYHPIATRVRAVLEAMVERSGGVPAEPAAGAAIPRTP